MIKEKDFYDDEYINSSIECKSALDHLNSFIAKKKLNKTDIVNVVIEHTEASAGHPSQEYLVLFYWDKEE